MEAYNNSFDIVDKRVDFTRNEIQNIADPQSKDIGYAKQEDSETNFSMPQKNSSEENVTFHIASTADHGNNSSVIDALTNKRPLPTTEPCEHAQENSSFSVSSEATENDIDCLETQGFETCAEESHKMMQTILGDIEADQAKMEPTYYAQSLPRTTQAGKLELTQITNHIFHTKLFPILKKAGWKLAIQKNVDPTISNRYEYISPYMNAKLSFNDKFSLIEFLKSDQNAADARIQLFLILLMKVETLSSCEMQKIPKHKNICVSEIGDLIFGKAQSQLLIECRNAEINADENQGIVIEAMKKKEVEQKCYENQKIEVNHSCGRDDNTEGDKNVCMNQKKRVKVLSQLNLIREDYAMCGGSKAAFVDDSASLLRNGRNNTDLMLALSQTNNTRGDDDGKKEIKSRTQFISASKLIPKYAGNNSKCRLFNPKMIEEYILDSIVGKISGRENLIKVTINELPSAHPLHKCALKLHIKAQVDLAKRIPMEIEKIINAHMAYYNKFKIINDPESIEIDVNLSKGKNSKIGARVDIHRGEFLSSMDKEKYLVDNGLWIRSLVEGGELGKVMGKSASKGAAIVKIGDLLVNDAKEFTEYWRRVREGSMVPFCICIFKGADTATVDKSRLLDKRKRIISLSNSIQDISSNDETAVNSSHVKVVEKSRNIVVPGKSTNDGITEKLSNGISTKKPSNLVSAEKLSKDLVAKKKVEVKKHEKANASVLASLINSSEKSNNTTLSYRNFCTKLKPVYELEGFKDNGVHIQSFYKSTWARHKRKFGTKCDDKCPCASDLVYLTQTVIDDVSISHSEKLELHKNEVGFVRYFLEKFKDALKKEFPALTDTRLLEVLINMWSKHKEERRFGLKCSKTCSCKDGFDSFIASILKRPQFCDLLNHPNLSNRFFKLQESQKRRNDNEMKNYDANTKKNMTNSAMSDEFAISFDPHVPLGFYCVTKHCGNKSGNICSIISLSRQGDHTKNGIQVGTVVVRTAICDPKQGTSQPKEVYGHNDLRHQYEVARQKSKTTKFKIWCTNAFVTNIPKKSNEDQWTPSGAWKGFYSDGWAGGASSIVQKNISKASVTRDHPAKKLVSALKNASDKGVRKSNTFEENEPVAVGAASKRPFLLKGLLRKTKNVNGLKKTDELRKCGKKVSFNKDLEAVKYFQTEKTLHDKSSVAKTNTALEKNEKFARNVGGDALSYAVQNNSYKKVLELLKKGHDPKQKDSMNKRPLDYIYEKKSYLETELNSANGSTSGFMKPNERARKNKIVNDLYLKKQLIKIFLEIENAVDASRHLKDWVKVEVIVDNISSVQLTQQGEKKAEKFPNQAFCVVKLDGKEMQPVLKPLPFNSYLDWSSTSFFVHFNPHVEATYRDRTLSVDLFRGLPGQGQKHHRLSTFNLSLEDMMDSTEEEGRWEFKAPLTMSGDLMGGKITVIVKTIQTNQGDIDVQKTRSIKAIHMLIGWIQNFQRDCSNLASIHQDNEEDMEDLSVNIAIPSSGEMTLLHAATAIGSLDTVRKLLELGANPSAASAAGTPIEMAKKLRLHEIQTILVDGPKTLRNLETEKEKRKREKECMFEEVGKFEGNERIKNPLSQFDGKELMSESSVGSKFKESTGESYVEKKTENINYKHTNDNDKSNTKLERDLKLKHQSAKRKLEITRRILAVKQAGLEKKRLAENGPVPETSEKTKQTVDSPTNPARSYHLQDPRAQSELVSEVRSILKDINEKPLVQSKHGNSFMCIPPSPPRTTPQQVHHDPRNGEKDNSSFTSNIAGHLTTTDRTHPTMFPPEQQYNEQDFMNEMPLQMTTSNRFDRLYANDFYGASSRVDKHFDDSKTYSTFKAPSNVIGTIKDSNERSNLNLYGDLNCIHPNHTHTYKDHFGVYQNDQEQNGRAGWESMSMQHPTQNNSGPPPPPPPPPLPSGPPPLPPPIENRSIGVDQLNISRSFDGPYGNAFSDASNNVENQWQIKEEWDSELASNNVTISHPPPPMQQHTPDHQNLRENSNIHNFGLKMDPRLLPLIPKAEWMEGKVERCRHFASGGGCRNGVACQFSHVQPPLEMTIDNIQPSQPDIDFKDSYITVKDQKAPNGRTWYTAAYRRPRDNIIYYAEKGNLAQISSQKVYWYPNEKAAKAAIRSVVSAASLADKEKSSQRKRHKRASMEPLFGQIQKRQRYLEQVEPKHFDKVAKRDGDSFNKTLKKILNVQNLQLVYNKIYPRTPLKKTYWKKDTRKIGGKDQYSVTFRCPDHNWKEYIPVKSGGAFCNGKWWYEEEKIAKAVTFLQFLMDSVNLGVLKDLSHTNDGREIF